MKKLAMIAGATMLALAVAGCSKETPAEKQVEKQADAIGDAYDADADLKESLAKGAPDQKAQEQQADALRKQGDAIEDHLKKEADEMGKDTRKMPDAAKQSAK